ncbi:hypothetical protein [Paenibacillus zanthoxyli]
MKSFVIGRKNWLFGTHLGGKI